MEVRKIKAFAMVRQLDDGYYYIDTETISCLSGITKEKAALVEKQCGPAWTKANGRVKVVRIEIKVA